MQTSVDMSELYVYHGELHKPLRMSFQPASTQIYLFLAPATTKAIVGSKVSSIAPNLEALPGVQDLKEIGSVALSRIDLFRYLIERTTLLLTQFSEILPTMSVSTATATLSLSSEVWAAAMSLSLHPTEDNVELLRSLESQIPGLLANPTCTAEERESLEVTSQMMQVRV